MYDPRSCLIGALLLGACGGELLERTSADADSDVFSTLYGQVFINLSNGEQLSNLRAAFGWYDLSTLGGCFHQANGEVEKGLECLDEVDISRIDWRSIQIKASQSLEFEIPLKNLPQPLQAFSAEGYEFALGSVAVFSDGNGNLGLDRVSRVATSSSDRLYTLSREFVVYKMGTTPGLSAVTESLNCPAIPDGFSILSLSRKLRPDPQAELVDGTVLYDHDAIDHCDPAIEECSPCTVRPLSETRIPLHIDDHHAASSKELICEEISKYDEVYPNAAPEYPERITCGKRGVQYVYSPHPDRYCRTMNSTLYSLIGSSNTGAWNLLTDVPSWWPCSIDVEAQ